MLKYIFISFLFLVGCASKTRIPSSEVPVGALDLEQALLKGPQETVAYLRTQVTEPPLEGIFSRDPSAQLPKDLRFEKNTQINPDKKERQKHLQRFHSWNLSRRSKLGEKLITDFSCDKAIESQALGLSLELDFPEQTAIDLSQQLHEKVLTCADAPKTESLFRLSVFAIQRNDCTKANEYFSQFPSPKDRSYRDRLNYLQTLCTSKNEVPERNPWGGYGILLNSKNDKKNMTTNSRWYLSGTSGVKEWDQLLASFIELTEKGKVDNIKAIAYRLNYEKFRSLPIAFQTSVLVLFSFNNIDLPVFQNLHARLSEDPNSFDPAAAKMLFPVRYWKEIVDNSKSADPVLVKSLIRQESAFDSHARSRARAAGLMQLIYPTARYFGVHQPQELLDPEKNIHAGSEFLANLIRDFGSVELALAAYNAGPAIVKEWQKRYPTSNIEVFVEMIPYTETREYVRLVTRNYRVYQNILIKPQILGDSR